MEKSYKFCQKEEDEIELPAGFRFHPTDEELITHYLLPKVANNNFSARAIGEADLNSCEPWDLPGRAKMGEKEWYFFCLKDRKYPTGLRANRATDAGYWKATGKDKEIFRGKVLVGMKKTLVFYKGRAPKGENTNWVMHEYRLEGRNSVPDSVKSSKNEWVLCRIFKKSSGGKKTYVPGLASMDPYRHELRSSVLPPLMDSSASYPHVTCFSNPTEDQKPHVTSVEMANLNSFKTPPPSNPNEILLPPSSSTSYLIPKLHVPNPSYLASISPEFGFFQYQEANHHHAMMIQENNSLLKMLIENDYNHQNPSSNLTYSSDVDCPSSSAGPLDIDSLWNY